MSHSSGGRKFKAKVPANAVPGDTFLPGFQMDVSRFVFTWPFFFFFGACTWEVGEERDFTLLIRALSV